MMECQRFKKVKKKKKQHTDEPNSLLNGAQITVNLVCCHQVKLKSGRSHHSAVDGDAA
jgi:hypothetical protein